MAGSAAGYKLGRRGLTGLLPDQAYRVAVRIADHHCLFEPELRLGLLWNSHHVRRDKLCACSPDRSVTAWISLLTNVVCQCHRIISLGVAGHWPSAGRRFVVEELDMRRRRDRHHRRHEARVVKQVVQHVLRRSGVNVTPPRLAQANPGRTSRSCPRRQQSLPYGKGRGTVVGGQLLP